MSQQLESAGRANFVFASGILPFRVGDPVAYHGQTGSVAANIDRHEYASAGVRGEFDGYSKGVLVQWRDGSVTHFREPHVNLVRAA